MSMKRRLGSLAIFGALVTVALLAFPGPALADGPTGEAQGVPFDLPQFGLADLLPGGRFSLEPTIDLIGEEVTACRNSSKFGQICSVRQVAGTNAGRCCPFGEAQAVPAGVNFNDPALIDSAIRNSLGGPPRVRKPDCYSGACPADPGMLGTWTPPGGCVFCTNDHSYGTTSAIRSGILRSGSSHGGIGTSVFF